MQKKYKFILIILILIVLIPTLPLVVFYLSGRPSSWRTLYPGTLVFGLSEHPRTIDPIDCWDAASANCIRQVAETLFWNNVSAPNYPLEPLLVNTFYWDNNNTELTLNLKFNITFHDGSVFNASAVKWNVDRWLYLTNATGNLPISTPVALSSPMYFFSDGISIINRSEIISNYSIKFVLNRPFGPFLSFLSYSSNAIISPSSHNQTDYIDLLNWRYEPLVGTGPFTFNYYTLNVEMVFKRYSNYWRGSPEIEKLIFDYYDQQMTKHNAFLAQNVQIIDDIDTSFLDLYNNDPKIVVYNAGTDLVYWYLGLNNYNLNVTWREIISYSFNYTHVIEKIRGGGAVRGCPGVPKIVDGHNSSTQANLPSLNRTLARILMQKMGFGLGFNLNNDSLWLTQASSAPFRELKLLRFESDSLNEELYSLLKENLKYIGCKGLETIVDRATYINILYNTPNIIDIFYWFWRLDYPEPFNVLNLLFHSKSPENVAQVNVSVVDSILDLSASEINELTRNEYYKHLQYLLFEQEYVHMPLWADIKYFVHLSYISGVQYNPFGYYYFYCCNTHYPDLYYPDPFEAIPGYEILLIIGMIAVILSLQVKKMKRAITH